MEIIMLRHIQLIKKVSACLVLFCLSSVGMAQFSDSERYQPYTPAGIPGNAPRWMQSLTDIENVNYYAMVDSFHRFQEENPKMRYKTPETKAVINYFKRWQRAYQPYVKPDGKIAMPSFSDFRKYVQDINADASRKARTRSAASAGAPTSQWTVLSPLMTYHSQKKKPFAGQANVQRFDIAPTNPNILYAGTETSMIFKTTDKGLNWTPCSPNFYFGGTISTIEISYSNPNKVLVGASAHLWLTTDGGDTWTDITPAQFRKKGSPVRDAVFHPSDDTRMLMGNNKGLYESTDNGQTWRLLQSGETFDIKYKYGNSDVIYVTMREEWSFGTVLKVSTNGGQTFEKRSPRLDYELSCGRIGLSEAPNGRGYIYFLACKADGSEYQREPFYFGTPVLFKSTDGGKSWTHHENLIKRLPSHEKTNGNGYYDMMIAASPKNPEQVFFGLLDFYRSDDGGQTLQQKGGYTGQFDLHYDMQDIHISGNDVWISTDGGLTYSPDFFGNVAEARNQGIYASQFLGFDQGWNEDVIVGGRHHNGNMVEMSTYKGVAVHVGGGETPTGYVLLSNPRKIAFSDSNPTNMLIPEEVSGTFEALPYFYRFPYEDTQTGQNLEFDPRYAQSFLMFNGYYQNERSILWKTVDDGQSFVQLYQFPNYINSHSISRSNPNKIVVSIREGLYQSLDGGQNFTAYDNIPDEVRNAQNTITAIHPRDENEIWVAVTDDGGEIFRTKDNGKTWENLREGLQLPIHSPLYESAMEKVAVNRFFLTGNEKNAVYAIAYVLRPTGTLDYLFPRGRVFYRDDTTNGWQDFSEGLPPIISLRRMLPFYKEGKIRIATNNGVWQRDLVDPDFKPIAQPLILNVGKGENPGETELHFDSYSIVNQKNATWEWKFNPQPLSVSDPNVRNPIVRIAANQSYDVTLTVTTPEGSDTKTIKDMIKGDVPTSALGQEVLAHDVVLSTNVCKKGETITLQPQGIAAGCKWQLFNAAGKVVDARFISPTGSTQIPTNTLDAGIYFFLLTNSNFKKTGKIVIR